MELSSQEEDAISSLSSSLPPENAEGNVEYKLKLIDVSPERLKHLVTQMKWRLEEGHGEAVYHLGVTDSGKLFGLQENELEESIATLQSMVLKLDANMTIRRCYTVKSSCQSSSKKVAEVLIRRILEQKQLPRLKIAAVGECGVGKSTLLSVLITGKPDDGNGRARVKLFQHLHEIESGYTSSVSHKVLGLDSQGNVVKNYSDSESNEDILGSSKILTLIDLAGRQKYFKTAILGLLGHTPHCFMFVVNARRGLAETTETANVLLRLAIRLKAPLFVVINKIDTCSKHTVKRTTEQVGQHLSDISHRQSFLVNDRERVIIAASSFSDESYSMIPVFQVSCVEGNLDLLRQFLNLLPIPSKDSEMQSENSFIEFQIDKIYDLVDVGLVLGGHLNRGILRENDSAWLGPSKDGAFQKIRVRSIHQDRKPFISVYAGQIASLAIDGVSSKDVRKGMVLVSNDTDGPVACRTFVAAVNWLSPERDIEGWQVCVHIRNVRQAAFVEAVSKSVVDPYDAEIKFCLIKQPEFIQEGNRIIFRQGNVIGIGNVKVIEPYLP